MLIIVWTCHSLSPIHRINFSLRPDSLSFFEQKKNDIKNMIFKHLKIVIEIKALDNFLSKKIGKFLTDRKQFKLPLRLFENVCHYFLCYIKYRARGCRIFLIYQDIHSKSVAFVIFILKIIQNLKHYSLWRSNIT